MMFKLLSLVASLAMVHQVSSVNIKQKTITYTKQLEEVEQTEFQKGLAQLGIQGLLQAQKGDFDQSVFEKMLTQDKELSHLLYSDMTALYEKIATEFQDYVKVQKIGESWQRRPIEVLTLDARDYMAKKNVSLQAPQKEKKEQKQSSNDNLAVNPGNVMVELAQTGSKFFDVVSHDEVMPQTAEDNLNAQNGTSNATQAKAHDSDEPKKTLDEELLDDPERTNEEDHHFHGEEYVQSNSEMDKETGNSNNAVLITGTTHPRELLSMQAPVFVLLKMLHQGIVQDNPKFQQMLAVSKYHFLPILNVDGAALVEKHYNKDKKIVNKRKNMSPGFVSTCGEEDAGTDLNRNWPIDWKSLDQNNNADVCGEFWPGTEPLSEPENKALNDFVAANKQDLKFIINCHTSGNDFVWPFNGRDPNDIDSRAPGYLTIFNDISKNAVFPYGVMFGNSQQVMGEKMNGDCDDYMLATYGIPSITSEMGHLNQYVSDWKCVSPKACFNILVENTVWMEYLFANVGKVAAIVQPK